MSSGAILWATTLADESLHWRSLSRYPTIGSRRSFAARNLIIFLSFVFLFPAPAHSQDAKKDVPADLAQLSLEELENIEVYSASKHLQKASDAPSAVG